MLLRTGARSERGCGRLKLADADISLIEHQQRMAWRLKKTERGAICLVGDDRVGHISIPALQRIVGIVYCING